MGVIYKITNSINGKVYIGQTAVSVKRRWNRHKFEATNGNSEMPIHIAMRKYGVHNFYYEIVEECQNSELDSREEYWILQENSFYDGGYNATLGGYKAPRVNSDEFISLWHEGLCCTEIEKMTNSSRNTISSYLCASGISATEIKQRGIERTRFHHFKNREHILDLWNEGRNCIQIAAIVSEDPRTISKTLKYYGIDDKTIKKRGHSIQITNRYRVVVQESMGGETLMFHRDARQAGQYIGLPDASSRIAKCCQLHRALGGYLWRYATSEEAALYGLRSVNNG